VFTLRGEPLPLPGGHEHDFAELVIRRIPLRGRMPLEWIEGWRCACGARSWQRGTEAELRARHAALFDPLANLRAAMQRDYAHVSRAWRAYTRTDGERLYAAGSNPVQTMEVDGVETMEVDGVEDHEAAPRDDRDAAPELPVRDGEPAGGVEDAGRLAGAPDARPVRTPGEALHTMFGEESELRSEALMAAIGAPVSARMQRPSWASLNGTQRALWEAVAQRFIQEMGW
jgi:hypothetical protein